MRKWGINQGGLDGVHESAENVPRIFWFLMDFVKGLRITMIYMHALNKVGHWVRSLIDGVRTVLYRLHKTMTWKRHWSRTCPAPIG